MDEIIKNILSGILNTFPIQAPKGCVMPFCVYRSSKSDDPYLDGSSGDIEHAFEIVILAASIDEIIDYSDAIALAINQIECTVQSGIYIQQIDIESSSQPESEPDINGISKQITVKISY